MSGAAGICSFVSVSIWIAPPASMSINNFDSYSQIISMSVLWYKGLWNGAINNVVTSGSFFRAGQFYEIKENNLNLVIPSGSLIIPCIRKNAFALDDEYLSVGYTITCETIG